MAQLFVGGGSVHRGHRQPPGSRLHPLTLAAVPLLVGLVLVIAERFVLLTS